MKIPFFKPYFGEEEKKAVCDVLDSGWVVMGEKTQEFEEKFAEYVGAKHAAFVDSCTSALDLALKYLIIFKKLSQNYPFEVPSLTFTSTAEVVVHNGLNIEFGDVEKDFCLETPHLDSLPVHLTGNKAKEGALIYDSAHRIEKDDMKDEGNSLWCYSFYATKNMTTVQGGMVATNNKESYEWLKMARDHGLDLGTKERYTAKYKQYDVKFVGWREKSDDMHAAIGLEQLKKLPWMTQQRNRIVDAYNGILGLKRTGNHVYPILVEKRDEFMEYMHQQGIQCTIHFRPLHQMTAYKPYYHGEPLPNTEYMGERIVSIPMFPTMTDEQIEYVAEKVKKSGLLINE